MKAKMRKLITVVDEVHREMGKEISPATRRAAALAVIENPLRRAVRGGPFGFDRRSARNWARCSPRSAWRRSASRAAQAESYGKAAIVGEGGELEHAAAILHPKMGTPVRKVLSKGAALIPSAKKMGGPGAPIDVPLGHKDAAYVRVALRRHGGARPGRAARARDRGGDRRD